MAIVRAPTAPTERNEQQHVGHRVRTERAAPDSIAADPPMRAPTAMATATSRLAAPATVVTRGLQIFSRTVTARQPSAPGQAGRALAFASGLGNRQQGGLRK